MPGLTAGTHGAAAAVSAAVEVLARHLVTLAGQLTVIDLWIEAEVARAPVRRGVPR